MSAVHINRPDLWSRRRIIRCPIDECMTECVVTVYVWHDSRIECTRCGESWSGGELSERPFARGWRKRAQAKTRAKWAVTRHGPFPTLEEMDPDLFAKSDGAT